MASISNEAEVTKDLENTRTDKMDGSSSLSTNSPSPSWRVTFLSSKVRHSSILNSAKRSSVLFVPYKYENSTLESLFLQAQQTLNGGKAESIAFLAHGQGSNMLLCASGDQV